VPANDVCRLRRARIIARNFKLYFFWRNRAAFHSAWRCRLRLLLVRMFGVGFHPAHEPMLPSRARALRLATIPPDMGSYSSPRAKGEVLFHTTANTRNCPTTVCGPLCCGDAHLRRIGSFAAEVAHIRWRYRLWSAEDYGGRHDNKGYGFHQITILPKGGQSPVLLHAAHGGR
jgi:hypothetical protein